MRKIVLLFLVLFLVFASTDIFAKDTKAKIILLILEQNIAGPQRAWWASEIDLSATEATIAKRLIKQGYAILEPSGVTKIIKKNPAFRKVGLSEAESIKLANLSQADYVVLGKAIASSGANVPQSNMRSYFANLSAQLIRVKDRSVIAYLDASGKSVHLDAITGGKEALVNAADGLAKKIINTLKEKQGGK